MILIPCRKEVYSPLLGGAQRHERGTAHHRTAGPRVNVTQKKGGWLFFLLLSDAIQYTLLLTDDSSSGRAPDFDGWRCMVRILGVGIYTEIA